LVLKAIFATTKLGIFGSIDAPEPNARAMDLYCVAVDNACLAGKVDSACRTTCRQQRGDQRYASDGVASEAVLHLPNTSTITVVIKPDWLIRV
jgi:hypothetical protein